MCGSTLAADSLKLIIVLESLYHLSLLLELLFESTLLCQQGRLWSCVFLVHRLEVLVLVEVGGADQGSL